MPSRRSALVAGLAALQITLLWATLRLPGLGSEGWHHVTSLAAVLAVCALAWRPLTRSRAFLAVGVLALTVLAGVSGFWLIYWKEAIRPAGYQDWGVFWHVAWSWGAAVFFFQHTWINRVQLAHFFRRSLATRGSALLHASAYGLLALAFAATWSSPGKDAFTVESYVPLTLLAWLAVTLPPYALWALATGLGARFGGLREALGRARMRGPVDVALVPIAALVVASGIPLTWFDPLMESYGWKYVSKFWHVWPSILFTALVFVHSLHFWRTTRTHWRNLGTPGDAPAAAARSGAGAGSGARSRGERDPAEARRRHL